VTNFKIDDETTYQQLYNNLCTQIIAHNDTTVLNDTEGLDLYFDVNVDSADPPNVVSTVDIVFGVVYGLKRKSSPTCS
jgi:hypothetical protein